MELPLKESRHGLGALFPQLLKKQRLKENGLPAVPQASGAVTLARRASGTRPSCSKPHWLICCSSSSRDSPEPPGGGGWPPGDTDTEAQHPHEARRGPQLRCCLVFQEGGLGEAMGKVLREDGHHCSTAPWGWCPNIDRSPFLSRVSDALGALLSPLPSPKFLFSPVIWNLPINIKQNFCSLLKEQEGPGGAGCGAPAPCTPRLLQPRASAPIPAPARPRLGSPCHLLVCEG